MRKYMFALVFLFGLCNINLAFADDMPEVPAVDEPAPEPLPDTVPAQ